METIEELREQLVKLQEKNTEIEAKTSKLAEENERLNEDNRSLRDYNNKLFARIASPAEPTEDEEQQRTDEQIVADIVNKINGGK